MTNQNNKRISSIILINLVLALVSLGKDILLASYLGTTAQADAFLLAYFVIDTIGNNLLASALGVAVIPVLAGLHGSGEDQRFMKVTRVLVIYTVIISTVLAFFMFGMRIDLISWVGSGLSGASRQLSVGLFSLLIPSLVAFPLINLGISIMQVNNRFIIPALAPVLFNIIFLFGLIYLLYFDIPIVLGVYSLSLYILLSLLLMLFLVWFPIIRTQLVSLPPWGSTLKTLFTDKSNEVSTLRSSFLSSDLVSVWKSFLPYLLTLLFPQIIFLVERYLASYLETGSISGLNYAFRLVQFPLWVFIAAVSTVLFPVMAKLSAVGDKMGFNKVLINSIYFTSLFTIPFSIILFVLRVPIISILLQRGEFSTHSAVITANIMAGYTLTIIWQGFSVIWVRASLVEGRVLNALLAAAVSAVSTIGADLVLVPLLGVTGLGYGAAIGAIINAATLFILFSRVSHFQVSELWRDLFKIILANLPLLLVTVILSQFWVRIAEIGTFSSRFGYVTVVITVCLAAYWLGLRLFRVELFKKDI